MTEQSRAQAKEHNNLMVLWERVLQSSQDHQTEFRSHLMFDVPSSEAQQFFHNLTPSATKYGSANITHPKSPLCLAQEKTETFVIDTTDMLKADKLRPLRGLNGVHVDLRAVRGPRTFTGDFGQSVHARVVKALTDAGIPLLTKEELEITPGRPNLTFRYSPEVPGCKPWSVSLSLKQTAVLTRDTRVMLEIPTWSGSARQSEDDIQYGSLEALNDAIATFVSDYAKANSEIATHAVIDTSKGN